MEIKIPEHLKESWEDYALNSGIPIEYLMIQSMQYFIKNDKLGVNEGKVKDLENRAKALEWQKRIDIVEKKTNSNSNGNEKQKDEKQKKDEPKEDRKQFETQNQDLPFEEVNLGDLN